MVLCGAGLPPPPDEEFVGGGSVGPSKTSALARVTATTTLAEARADVGSRSRDSVTAR